MLENSIKRIIDYYYQDFFSLSMMGLLFCSSGNVSGSNLGQRLLCEMTSVDFTAQTNTQTCPGARTLHLQRCCWTEVIQLCPSTFVFVYPYCSKAWFNSPEISRRISRCCADPRDPVTSTVMICVCAVARWGIAALAASFLFSPLPGPWVMLRPERGGWATRVH